MRQSKAAKAETHQAIVAAASRLFRARGVERTSVADVMQAADKTHGGFYRHFATKDALLESALDEAFAGMEAVMADGMARAGRDGALRGFAAHYLGPDHVGDAGTGCPVAALATEIAHAGETVRQHFGAGVMRQIGLLAEGLDDPAPVGEARAARAFAMAVGAVMIARASDPATGERVLSAVRAGLADL